MSREVDRRSTDAYLHSSATGLRTEVGVLALERSQTGYYIQRALANVKASSAVLGLEPSIPLEFSADPHIHQTSSGAAAVHLHQQYKSIPVFQATQVVSFAPDGFLERKVADTIPGSEDLPVEPVLSAGDAVAIAAVHVTADEPGQTDTADQFGEPLHQTLLDVAGFVPKVVAAFPELPSQPTVLEPGPFAQAIKGSLVWCPIDGSMRLAWQVILALPNMEGQYQTLVDAESGEILYCAQITHFLTAKASVYRVNGGQSRELVDFPLDIESHGLPMPRDLPQDFPDPWVDDEHLSGNAVRLHLELTEPGIRGQKQHGVLTFDPIDAKSNEQKLVNAFYYNCLMHDFFYLLGFREQEGNFQRNNFKRGGVALDAIDVHIYPEFVQGTANMQTPVDGKAPKMNLGLVNSTNRHTALDSSVVFHEYTHGVSHRLVGGPMNYRAMAAPQSRGIDEGLSDYVACTVTGDTVIGAWCVNRPSGIRGLCYDGDFPDHFGELGQGRYTEPHSIGEIWCAALLDMNRNIGVSLSLQLVVDALKLAPANPNFLQMRDAIILALDHLRAVGRLDSDEYTTALERTWRVFVKFGMGPAARSDGAYLTGIVADFNMPASLPQNSAPTDSGEQPIMAGSPSGTDSHTTASRSAGSTRTNRKLRRRSDTVS